MQCIASKGDLPIKITWLHNGIRLEEDEGLHIIKTSTRISTLNFEYVQANHRGNYTCVARNLAGTVDYTTTFNINGAFPLKHFFCTYVIMA